MFVFSATREETTYLMTKLFLQCVLSTFTAELLILTFLFSPQISWSEEDTNKIPLGRDYKESYSSRLKLALDYEMNDSAHEIDSSEDRYKLSLDAGFAIFDTQAILSQQNGELSIESLNFRIGGNFFENENHKVGAYTGFKIDMNSSESFLQNAIDDQDLAYLRLNYVRKLNEISRLSLGAQASLGTFNDESRIRMNYGDLSEAISFNDADLGYNYSLRLDVKYQRRIGDKWLVGITGYFQPSISSYDSGSVGGDRLSGVSYSTLTRGPGANLNYSTGNRDNRNQYVDIPQGRSRTFSRYREAIISSDRKLEDQDISHSSSLNDQFPRRLLLDDITYKSYGVKLEAKKLTSKNHLIGAFIDLSIRELTLSMEAIDNDGQRSTIKKNLSPESALTMGISYEF